MALAADIKFTNPVGLARPMGYSHLADVRGGRLIFIAGQTGTIADGTVMGEQDFSAQVEQAFSNLSVALASVGCSAANLVKLTVYLRDMGRLAEYRQARDNFFRTVDPPAAPAITLLEVSSLFDAKLLVEIEAIAAA
jgi:enamine deaminase RidA (YjgF/YER057c/UK114 family)